MKQPSPGHNVNQTLDVRQINCLFTHDIAHPICNVTWAIRILLHEQRKKERLSVVTGVGSVFPAYPRDWPGQGNFILQGGGGGVRRLVHDVRTSFGHFVISFSVIYRQTFNVNVADRFLEGKRKYFSLKFIKQCTFSTFSSSNAEGKVCEEKNP